MFYASVKGMGHAVRLGLVQTISRNIRSFCSLSCSVVLNVPNIDVCIYSNIILIVIAYICLSSFSSMIMYP